MVYDLVVNGKPPIDSNKELINIYKDIMNYYHLFTSDGFSGNVRLQFLPLNKGYYEHPYAMIIKINYILEIFNNVISENNKNKKDSVRNK